MKKERARAFKIAKYSTSSACANANGGGSGKESLGLDLTNSVKEENRKKSPLYTRTGDKGMSSVRELVVREALLYFDLSLLVVCHL